MANEIILNKEMLDKIEDCLKHAQYDGDKLVMEIGPFAPCSITQAFMPQILDLGLKALRVKVQCGDIILDSESDKPHDNPKDTKQKVLVRVWP